MKRWGDLGGALEVPRDLLLRRYPPFVTGGPLLRGDVPVFVFHSIEPAQFARKAEYLAANGYVSLSAAEYFEVVTKSRPAPERAVVLTFDDGRRSVLTEGLPILQRFGLKGIVFLVPGRTPASPPPADDGEGFLSWHDADTLVRSGLFDIESHSLTHARVHVSGRVDDFLTPPMRRGYEAMDVPLLASGSRDLLAPEGQLGTPLLESAPRLSDAVRFLEDESYRRRTIAVVREEGGERFFDHPDWEARLRGALDASTLPGRHETEEERVRAIRRELVESRRLIEEHTGREVRHLCYPWHISGKTAEAIAVEAGYLTAFCGKVAGVPLTRPGGDVRRIARIGEDYVELLPGKDRLSLATILRRKWSRRFGAD